MLKKFAVVKWCAFVSGGGGIGRVAAEDGPGPQTPPPQPAWGDGESEAAEDFPRPRARPRRRYTRFLRGEWKRELEL